MAEGDEGSRCFRPLLFDNVKSIHTVSSSPSSWAGGLAVQTSELNGAFQHVGRASIYQS